MSECTAQYIMTFNICLTCLLLLTWTLDVTVGKSVRGPIMQQCMIFEKKKKNFTNVSTD